MQKSLFSKYYSICVMMILVSIALIGSVFLILTSNYFEQEKYDLLSRNVKQAVSITMEDLSVNDYDYVSASRVLNVYTILGDAIDADIFLVDVNGKTLLCTETSGCNHSLYSVDEDVMSQVIRGEYHNVGHLGSIYSTPHYIVGVPLTTPNGSVVDLWVSTGPDTSAGGEGESQVILIPLPDDRDTVKIEAFQDDMEILNMTVNCAEWAYNYPLTVYGSGTVYVEILVDGQRSPASQEVTFGGL